MNVDLILQGPCKSYSKTLYETNLNDVHSVTKIATACMGYDCKRLNYHYCG